MELDFGDIDPLDAYDESDEENVKLEILKRVLPSDSQFPWAQGKIKGLTNGK